MNSSLLDSVLLRTDFPGLQLHASGKVRDVYRLDPERLLFVATDRISAFDYVLATGIPHNGKVCGIELPKGLRESDPLPEPIFTPATKATTGHDENISFSEMVRLVGADLSEELRDLTLRIYKKASEYARTRGIIIADTKFEFGRTARGTTLADEVLTPDSSRFWPADRYQPGKAQESYDKQYVRDYLEEIRWNKQPPAPGLPAEVAQKTSEKYLEAYEQLTGRKLNV